MREMWARRRTPPGGRRRTTLSAVAVRDMERAGIDIVTDGEQRRESYFNQFATALDGLDSIGPGRRSIAAASPSRCPGWWGPSPAPIRSSRATRGSSGASPRDESR